MKMGATIDELAKRDDTCYIYDRKTGKHSRLIDGCPELLFPNWQSGHAEKVVFIAAHEDDPLAGSATLINYLTKGNGIDVHFFVLTNGSQGFYPEKILQAYPDFFEKDFSEHPDVRRATINQVIENMGTDLRYKVNIANFIQPKIEQIRELELAAAIQHFGMKITRNVHYYTHKGRKIDDLNIKPYEGMKLLDGEPGIDAWLIEQLRQIGATRVLVQSPGDPHKDHVLASQIGKDALLRSTSNLWHRGIPAPIIPYDKAEQIYGMYYVIYNRMSQEMGFVSQDTGLFDNRSRIVLIGTESDREKKREILGEFKSQPSLVPLFDRMPRKGKLEYYHPTPPPSPTLSEEHRYNTD